MGAAMDAINFTLMTLAFLLGLVLTSTLMIRRGEREVPAGETQSSR